MIRNFSVSTTTRLVITFAESRSKAQGKSSATNTFKSIDNPFSSKNSKSTPHVVDQTKSVKEDNSDAFPGFNMPPKMNDMDKHPLAVATSGGMIQRLLDTPRYVVVGVALTGLLSGYLFWAPIFEEYARIQKRKKKRARNQNSAKQTPSTASE